MNRGFTLLEVMVAIAILAIALTTLLGSQNQSMFAAEQADFSVQSALLARTKMAEVLASDEASVVTTGDFGDDFPRYTWRVEMTDPDLLDAAVFEDVRQLLRRIDVTVYADNERRTFTLTRIVLNKEGR